MSAAVKLSSATLWFVVAFVVLSTQFIGNIDGFLFPPIDRSRTVINLISEADGVTTFNGTFYRTRPCVYKGVTMYAGSGIPLDVTRVGFLKEFSVGEHEFPAWAAKATSREVLCEMKMIAEYACYWDSPHFPLITTAVFYDGAKITDPRCAD